MTLGETIRAARKFRGFSQWALAKNIGTSQHTVSTWERGAHDPRLPHLQSVASVLKVGLIYRPGHGWNFTR